MRVAAIILAAGGSSRFGKPKQLAIFQGQSLVRRAVSAALAAHCVPVVVVAGAKVETIAAELSATSAIVIENKIWREGPGSSVRAGMAEIRRTEVEAVVLLACDQPFVSTSKIEALIALAGTSSKPIVASAYADTFGIPALFTARYFAELSNLAVDRGAKELIISERKNVALLDFPEGAIDIDTPADYENLIAAE